MRNQKAIRSGLAALSLVFATGCGVFAVPDQAVEAVQQWKSQTGESDPCRVNAMEHCVAASAVADRCGSTCAVLLGRLLEIRQGDNDPMDLHNNRAGAACAAPIKVGVGGAVECCEDLLNREPPGLRTDGRCGRQ